MSGRSTKVLNVLHTMSKSIKREVTTEEIVVAAWMSHPEDFCLDGFPQYPDSSKVIFTLMGRKGLVGKGFLKRVGPGRYFFHWRPLGDDDLILALLATNASTLLQCGGRDKLSVDHLYEYLGVAHKDPKTDPHDAIESLKSRMADIESVDDCKPGLRVAINVLDYLLERFKNKLPEPTPRRNEGEHTDRSGNKKADRARQHRNRSV